MIEIPKQLQNKKHKHILIKPKDKIPIEKSWQKENTYKYNNSKLIKHLEKNGNYGVLCGVHGLVVIDFDDKEIQEEIVPKLPKTFTVKTGSGLLHKYFFVDNPKSFKILDDKNNTLVDIQGQGKQVVGAGSIHPNGNQYVVQDASSIATMKIAEIKALFSKYLIKKPQNINIENNGVIKEIKSRINVSDLLKQEGIPTNKNPTECPFHTSKGGKCLSFTDELWHCFHCDKGGDIFTLYQQIKGVDFLKAKQELAEKTGIEINEKPKINISKPSNLRNPSNLSNLSNNNLDYNLSIIENGDISFQNLNQGVFKGVWYFGKGVSFKGGVTECVINSNREVLLNSQIVGKNFAIGQNELKEAGFNYLHQLEANPYSWSNKEIVSFVKGTSPKIDTYELFNKIRNCILYYMDLVDERQADVIACWLMGSYCYELFESCGYIYLNAFFESGKSKLKKIIRLIGFNGQEASNISEAAFFRSIENSKGVLCIDEYEELNTDRKKITDQLLNAGIEKGSCVKRVEKVCGKFVNRSYDVYCPKVICNITGLNRVTQSRCITIKLFRTKSEKGKRKPKVNDPKWQKLRNELYLWVMQNWKEINNSNEVYDNEKLKNRNEDVWRIIFVIAKFVSVDIEKRISEFSEENITDTRSEIFENDWTFILLKTLRDNVNIEEWYKVKEIKTWLDLAITTEKRPGDRWIGKQLRNMPVFKHRNNPDSEYLLSPEKIQDTMERLNFTKVTKVSGVSKVSKGLSESDKTQRNVLIPCVNCESMPCSFDSEGKPKCDACISPVVVEVVE